MRHSSLHKIVSLVDVHADVLYMCHASLGPGTGPVFGPDTLVETWDRDIHMTNSGRTQILIVSITNFCIEAITNRRLCDRTIPARFQ